MSNDIRLDIFLQRAVAKLASKFGGGNFGRNSRPPLDDAFATLLLEFLSDTREDIGVSAFVALSLCAPEPMGRQLSALGWRPPAEQVVEAHDGSTAVIAATKMEEFTEVLSLLAPWRYPDAAVERGEKGTELLQIWRVRAYCSRTSA